MVVNMKFEGSYVALITPFKSNGEVDEDKVRELFRAELQEKHLHLHLLNMKRL